MEVERCLEQSPSDWHLVEVDPIILRKRHYSRPHQRAPSALNSNYVVTLDALTKERHPPHLNYWVQLVAVHYFQKRANRSATTWFSFTQMGMRDSRARPHWEMSPVVTYVNKILMCADSLELLDKEDEHDSAMINIQDAFSNCFFCNVSVRVPMFAKQRMVCAACSSKPGAVIRPYLYFNLLEMTIGTNAPLPWFVLGRNLAFCYMICPGYKVGLLYDGNVLKSDGSSVLSVLADGSHPGAAPFILRGRAGSGSDLLRDSMPLEEERDDVKQVVMGKLNIWPAAIVTSPSGSLRAVKKRRPGLRYLAEPGVKSLQALVCEQVAMEALRFEPESERRFRAWLHYSPASIQRNHLSHLKHLRDFPTLRSNALRLFSSSQLMMRK